MFQLQPECSTDFDVVPIKGDAVTLQDPESNVSVDIPAGIKGILRRKIHTEFSRFLHIVPDEECFIGPVVELHLKPFPDDESEQHQYRIRIPHCLQTKEEMSLVKVRCGDTRRKIPFRELPNNQQQSASGTDEERSSIKIHSGDDKKIVELKNRQRTSGKIPFYEVDEHHVVIYTNHFTEYICSSCSKTCLSYIMAFPFGCILPGEDGDDTQTKVEVYLCCSLYNIADFKKVSFLL